MDSSKTAYEPVSTEEEPIVEPVVEAAADVEAAPADADEAAPIVETTPEVVTPPEVVEENEKNAEKTAAAVEEKEEEAKKEVEEKEPNGNLTDLDSSIIPLKEVRVTDGRRGGLQMGREVGYR